METCSPLTREPRPLPVFTRTRRTTWCIIFYDHLSNTRVSYACTLDTTTGTLSYEIKNFIDYFPSGKVLRIYSAEAERYMTTTNERDAESGWDYRNMRYSDNEYMRFLSIDPMADKFVNQSPYVYVDNNPVNKVDPNGDCPECIYSLIMQFNLYRNSNREAVNNALLTIRKSKTIAPTVRGRDVVTMGLKLSKELSIGSAKVGEASISGGIALNSTKGLGAIAEASGEVTNVASVNVEARYYPDKKQDSFETDVKANFAQLPSKFESDQEDFIVDFKIGTINFTELGKLFGDAYNQTKEYIKTEADRGMNPQNYVTPLE
jgi:RHS repeat-associated protein